MCKERKEERILVCAITGHILLWPRGSLLTYNFAISHCPNVHGRKNRVRKKYVYDVCMCTYYPCVSLYSQHGALEHLEASDL